MSIRRSVVACGVLACAALAAPAQDAPEPPSKSVLEAIEAAGKAARGATVANVVPGAFRAQLVVDNRYLRPKLPDRCDYDKAPAIKEPEVRDPRDRTGKIHCLVCEYGLSPTVAIFVRSDMKGAAPDSGLGQLVKAVNGHACQRRSDKLGAFMIYLKLVNEEKTQKPVKIKMGNDELDVTVDKEYPDDEKRDAFAAELRQFATALGNHSELVPFGLAPIKFEPAQRFAVGEMTPITVIIYNRLRMTQRWELTPDELNAAKIAEILAATDEMIGIKKK